MVESETEHSIRRTLFRVYPCDEYSVGYSISSHTYSYDPTRERRCAVRTFTTGGRGQVREGGSVTVERRRGGGTYRHMS